MSFNYLAHYAFEFPESALRPDDQKHGTGSIPINTDEEPTTAEHFMEITRHIGKLGGYAKVALMRLEPTDHFVDDSAEILEGLIVND